MLMENRELLFTANESKKQPPVQVERADEINKIANPAAILHKMMTLHNEIFV